MLEMYLNILCDLLSKFDSQIPHIQEVFGITGIVVSSAALILYLKWESINNMKAQVSENIIQGVEIQPQTNQLQSITKNVADEDSGKSERELIFRIHQAAALSQNEEQAQHCVSLLMNCPHAVNNPREPHGFTPFLRACWAGSLTLVRFMLQNGAMMEKCTDDGDSPLYLAVRALLETQQEPRIAILKILVGAGASVNAANNYGFTPLHLAAISGDMQIARWLLNHGASPCLRTHNGLRPIDFAQMEGHFNMMSMMTVSVVKPQSLLHECNESCYSDKHPSIRAISQQRSVIKHHRLKSHEESSIYISSYSSRGISRQTSLQRRHCKNIANVHYDNKCHIVRQHPPLEVPLDTVNSPTQIHSGIKAPDAVKRRLNMSDNSDI